MRKGVTSSQAFADNSRRITRILSPLSYARVRQTTNIVNH